jgi:hypothetical protein
VATHRQSECDLDPLLRRNLELILYPTKQAIAAPRNASIAGKPRCGNPARAAAPVLNVIGGAETRFSDCVLSAVEQLLELDQ